MEMGYIIIFWYGVLHAFGPDHLSAIADFSIGKSMKKTMMITLLFAFGHGFTLFLFAKLLETYHLPQNITSYGDIISSTVIIGMGLYILYMLINDKIHLNKHIHDKQEHIHIYFGERHSHEDDITNTSAWGMGVLMGIGGVRGMLITLGMLNSHSVDFSMILAFIAGVSLVFVSFGGVILYLNTQLLKDIKNVRRVFAAAGLISVAVGTNMLLA
jgi:ABC-type nickel/cobalt efflux system permease component RcnA